MINFSNNILKFLFTSGLITVAGILSVACFSEAPANSGGGLPAQPVARQLEPTQPAADQHLSTQPDLELVNDSDDNASTDVQISSEREPADREEMPAQSFTQTNEPTKSNPPADFSDTSEAPAGAGDATTTSEPKTALATAPTDEPTSLPAGNLAEQQATPTPEPIANLHPLKSTKQVEIDFSQFRQMLPRDEIEPIYDPQFVSSDQSSLQAGELVIGVEINGESRAYPVGPLNQREMVNDTVGGIPILVSW